MPRARYNKKATRLTGGGGKSYKANRATRRVVKPKAAARHRKRKGYFR